ncbi:MAG: hypothetical protein FJZ00_05655, partial [Candidatus Sericytochromatia bacterium]|nr:hypothetical protein [Candidatus Tanganyikabacteria bacterium]
AYPVDFEARLTKAIESGLLPAYRDLEQIVRNRKPSFSWKVDLPRTPDFKDHRTFVTPPMPSPGLYVVAASAKQDFDSADNRVLAVDVIVTDLVLMSRADGGGGLDITVLSGASGKPVPGVDVTLYRYNWRTPPREVRSGRTGGTGEVQFEWQPRHEVGESTFLVGRKGGHLALDQSYFSLYKPSVPGEATSALIYTDRSIYRPDQKVMFKVVAYRGRGDQARYRTLAGEGLRVSLYDSNSQEAAWKQVKTNRYGTASGEFTVPGGRALGQWRVGTSFGGSQAVRVEEYKRPTFEVKLKDPEAALRLNKPAALVGEAKYYFGLPVTAGQVRWRVTRQPVYPWWWDWDWWGIAPRSQNAQTIAAGNTALGPDGTFRFTFTPEVDERLKGAEKGLSYRYQVSADCTDEGGETRSADRSFRLGTVAVEAAFRADAGFFRSGATGSVVVTRTDLDGVARPGKGSWRLVMLKQPGRTRLPAEEHSGAGGASPGSIEGAEDDASEGSSSGLAEGTGSESRPARPGGYKTPGDRLRARWETGYSPDSVMRRWPDGATVARGDLAHDAKGEAEVLVEGLKPGAYRLRYETKDTFGASFEGAKDFLVAEAPGVRSVRGQNSRNGSSPRGSQRSDSRQSGSQESESRQSGSQGSDSRQSGSQGSESRQSGSQGSESRQSGSQRSDSRQSGSISLPAVLIAEAPSVQVGGTARFMVASGLPDQTLLFDIFKAGKLIERKRLDASSAPQVVEIPIGEDDRGGFGVTLTVVRDHQVMTQAQSVFVPWDNKELQLSFATFRDTLRPGQRETWKVTVRGPKGGKVEAGGAELLAYMYDRSLDVFAPHAPPSPLGLYPNRTGVAWGRATLGSVSGQWLWNDFAGLPGYPHLQGDGLIFFDSYGIGGPGYRGGSHRMRSMMSDGAAPAPMAAAPAEAEMAQTKSAGS